MLPEQATLVGVDGRVPGAIDLAVVQRAGRGRRHRAAGSMGVGQHVVAGYCAETVLISVNIDRDVAKIAGEALDAGVVDELLALD